MYKYDQFQMKSYYEEVLAFKVNDDDGLPRYFCFECATLLNKFHKFKEKCYRGQKVLKELLWLGPISYEAIYKIDRENKYLQSDLAVLTVTDRVKFYVTVDSRDDAADEPKIDKHLSKGIISEETVDHHDYEKSFDSHTIDVPSSPIMIFKDIEKNCIRLKNDTIRERYKSTSGDESNLREKLLDSNNWKVFNLTEEEALKEFRLRAEDKKYLSASYKCRDCFRGFSKESMLRCHIQLKHSEGLGYFECRFCKMRFRWRSHLRRHMHQHYTKYQCLRCNRICPLENTAIRHDEYHSGVTKECSHCGKHFRHSSTYYTHLRTHRSGFVCVACGASFVSEAGLRQHRHAKHYGGEIESPDDDEEVNSYCSRCDIRFETRKAYEEHLFHSAMHSEVLEKERQAKEESEERTINAQRKVLGKKMQAKIIQGLRRRKSDDEPVASPQRKRRCRQKRRYCKPTTCHQCGKHFATQSACMKHHHTEHPRTSFFPPTERHICEVCGASLAPGSVATHQNMHTRTKVHPCEICGRQFYATVGLKRHLLTHTGEKPFACTLCDKRFTQSNSMKLHYRTFHLKQPYPKRSRSKKARGTEGEETTEEESDESQPKRETDDPIAKGRRGTQNPKLPLGGNVQKIQQEMPVSVVVDDNMHYLTLN
ncbi:unnamed protein product, partial [Iphiclides podalirius]